MALDLNSELTVILSGASSAMLELEPEHPAREALAEVLSAVERCTGKCSGLLAFASRHGFRPARAPLAAIMQL